MPQFWLGTFRPTSPPPPTNSPSQPLAASGASTFAIEVIREDAQIAVLFLTVDDVDKPQRLTCLVGFVNGAQASSMFRDAGFPLVDAEIVLKDTSGALSVNCACFGEEPEMMYNAPLISLTGVRFEEDPNGGAIDARYDQAEFSPDYLDPATSLLRKAVYWRPNRSRVHAAKALGLTVYLGERIRVPNLVPLESGQLTILNAWSGQMDDPRSWKVEPSPEPEQRSPRADTFGVPAFRFDDVEEIGFRVDLADSRGDVDAALAELVDDLNFHLSPVRDQRGKVMVNSVSDFRYRAATRTIVIELLRYGKMRLRTPAAPLSLDDFQSQHELVVRVLVGRVDDDTAQARDAAVWVPAIFVDNPWSKIVGRDLQGFDKQMAAFRLAGTPGTALTPNGTDTRTQSIVPLHRVSTVHLVENVGPGAATEPLVDFSYPGNAFDDPFEDIDLELALSGSSLLGARWQQSDFEDAEFRRSFARAAMPRMLKGFRSIQVAPVSNRILEKTWISGTFTVDDPVGYAAPRGVASLTFHAPKYAPERSGWLRFCSALGIGKGGSASRSFATGSWYRMKFSMNLVIDNGLQ